MKKVAKIIARQRIINPITMKPHDDEGLFALDGILYGNSREVDASMDDEVLRQSLIREFESEHPYFNAHSYELVTKTKED